MVMIAAPGGLASPRLMELENVEDRFDTLTKSLNLGGDSTKANVTSKTFNRLQNFISLNKLLLGAQRYETLPSSLRISQRPVAGKSRDLAVQSTRPRFGWAGGVLSRCVLHLLH